jgi:hypothetical protein
MARASSGTSTTRTVSDRETASGNAPADNPDLHDRADPCPGADHDAGQVCTRGETIVRSGRDDDQGGEPPCWTSRSEIIDDDYLYWPLD